MLRNVRKITPLLRSLLLGVAAVSTVSVSSAVMIGCEDENSPEFSVKRLDNIAMRPMAVKRIVQFFEDAMSRAGSDRSDKAVQALLDKIVPPLVRTYVENADTTDDRTRGEIIKLLADSRDERAKPALIKAVKDYKPNVGETHLRASAKAISQMKIRDQEAMDALIAAFVRFEAGSKNGSQYYVDIKAALVEVSHESWVPQLIERLNRPMEIPGQADRNDEEKITTYRNEQFWQTTAAEILGEIKSPDAVKPLFKTVIDPNKGDVAATAVMAMVKIGKPSMNTLIDSLLGKDEEMIEYAKGKIKDQKEAVPTLIRSAALVIGTIGRADGVDPLLLALSKIDKADYLTQAIIARELPKCPRSDESFRTFTRIFEAMPMSVLMPPAGNPAVQVLAEDIGRFSDRTTIDTLIKRRDTLKGDQQDKDMMRDSVLGTMVKLMRADQVAVVEAAITRWVLGKDEAKAEKDALEKAKKLLSACEEKIDCYLAKLDEPQVQEKDEQFTGIKAAYMLAMLGNEATALEIARRFPKIKNGAIKFAAGLALDRLTPNGSQAIADVIAEQLKVNLEKGDQNLIQGDAPLRQIRFRLLARL